jgi:hypothetical protein
VKLQETQVPANSSIHLNMTGYAPGVYFLRLKKEQGTETQQIIKRSN